MRPRTLSVAYGITSASNPLECSWTHEIDSNAKVLVVECIVLKAPGPWGDFTTRRRITTVKVGDVDAEFDKQYTGTGRDSADREFWYVRKPPTGSTRIEVGPVVDVNGKQVAKPHVGGLCGWVEPQTSGAFIAPASMPLGQLQLARRPGSVTNNTMFVLVRQTKKALQDNSDRQQGKITKAVRAIKLLDVFYAGHRVRDKPKQPKPMKKEERKNEDDREVAWERRQCWFPKEDEDN